MTTDIFDEYMGKKVPGIGGQGVRLGLLKDLISNIQCNDVVNQKTPEGDAAFIKAFLTKSVPWESAFMPFEEIRQRSNAQIASTCIYRWFRPREATSEEFPQTPFRLLPVFAGLHPHETALLEGLNKLVIVEP